MANLSGRVPLWKGRARHLVLLVSPSPYSPEVIKESLLKLGKQQGDGRLSVHGDDPLAGSQGSVTHKLVLISKSLHTLRGWGGQQETPDRKSRINPLIPNREVACTSPSRATPSAGGPGHLL